MYDHRMLAEFRHRKFALGPDATKPPEDVLSALVDLWCKRSAVKPLRLILPVRTEDGNIPDPANARAVLQSVVQFPDNEVSPSEKCLLSLAIAALSERITSVRAAGNVEGRAAL
jgi:hypothetical protein